MVKRIGLASIFALVAAMVCTVLSMGGALAQTKSTITVQTIQIDPGQMTVIQTNQGLVNLSDAINLGKPPVIVVQSPQKPSGPVCGGANQPRCGGQPAVFESAALGNCPNGSFFDVGLWQCWSCPSGFKRGLAAVDSDRACTKPNKNIRGTFTKATFIGPVCPPGSFYDTIRDGECRKCPAGYTRSAAHVDANNACFIPGGEKFSKIQRHNRGTGLLKTDCPRGQFWDGIDGYCYSCPSGFNRTGYSVRDNRACSQSVKEKQAKAEHVKKGACGQGEFRDPLYQRGGAGGTCWVCPTAQDRTVFPVNGDKACEKGGGIEFKAAKKIADLTCPAGQVFDFIGLTARDISTRPELKGKSVKPVKSGTCWSCPSGYDRSLSSIMNKDACVAKSMVWYSQPFNEPVLFSLAGAEAVLLDIAKRHPSLIATSIHESAKKAAADNNKLSFTTALAAEKKLFQTAPERSTSAAAAVLTRVLAAVAEPKHASPAEKQLANSFTQHIINKRSHVANDALAAYDAWKDADTYWRRKEGSNRGLMTLLDYGTVPPDYSSVAMMNSLALGSASTAFSIATGSIPVLGDVVGVALGAAGNGFADFSDPERAVKFSARTAAEIAIGKAIEFAIEQLAKSTVKSLATQAAQKVGFLAAHRAAAEVTKQAGSRLLSLAGSAGPQIIISVAFMIATTAIDQVTEIINARPKLLNAVANAKYDPQLARMVKTNSGTSELLGYWSFLITTDKKPSAKFTKEFAKYASTAVNFQPAPAAETATKSTADAGKWVRLSGSAVDIGVGANGKVWVIGANAVAGGYGIYRWDGKWTNIKGGAVRIAVGPNGDAWVVNSKDEIFHYNGGGWTTVKGMKARDIGVGAGGQVWVIGTDREAGGYGIYRLVGADKWQKVPGSAVRIAVDPEGNAWVANNKGEIFRFAGGKWVTMPGQAADIGIGANGRVWKVGGKKSQGGYEISYFDGKTWKSIAGALSDIAVGPKGEPYGVNAIKQIFVLQ